jgi:hypothetical protein
MCRMTGHGEFAPAVSQQLASPPMQQVHGTQITGAGGRGFSGKVLAASLGGTTTGTKPGWP